VDIKDASILSALFGRKLLPLHKYEGRAPSQFITQKWEWTMELFRLIVSQAFKVLFFFFIAFPFEELREAWLY